MNFKEYLLALNEIEYHKHQTEQRLQNIIRILIRATYDAIFIRDYSLSKDNEIEVVYSYISDTEMDIKIPLSILEAEDYITATKVHLQKLLETQKTEDQRRQMISNKARTDREHQEYLRLKTIYGDV